MILYNIARLAELTSTLDNNFIPFHVKRAFGLDAFISEQVADCVAVHDMMSQDYGSDDSLTHLGGMHLQFQGDRIDAAGRVDFLRVVAVKEAKEQR